MFGSHTQTSLEGRAARWGEEDHCSALTVGVAVRKAGESGRTLPLLVAAAVGEVDPDGLGELVGAAGGLEDALGWIERNV